MKLFHSTSVLRSSTAAVSARVSGRGLLGLATVAAVSIGAVTAAVPAASAAPVTGQSVTGQSVAGQSVAGQSVGYVSGGARISPNDMRMINYYPSGAAWTNMWSNYDHAKIDSDFKVMRSYNANTVRIILQATPGALGYPHVTANGASKIRDILTTAAARGLFVQLTLFDNFGAYTKSSDSKLWVDDVAAAVPDMNQISLIELKNEMPTTDIAPGTTGLAWTKTMLPYLATKFPGIPRTMSVYGADQSVALTALETAIPASLGYLDVVEFHAYMSLYQMATQLRAAITIAAGRPLLIGETGQATTGAIRGITEESQAAYYQAVYLITSRLGLPPVSPWTLNDFTPTAKAPTSLSLAQQTYGLRRLDGTGKPAALVTSQTFTDDVAGLNTDAGGDLQDATFAHEAATYDPATNLYGAWKVANPSYATAMGMDATVSHSGNKSAYITGAGGDSSHVAGIYENVPVTTTTTTTATATAWIKLTNATGSSRIAYGYFDKNGTYLGQSESPSADTTNTNWQQVTLTAQLPTGTTLVQVHMKSSFNTGTAYFDDSTLTFN